MAREPGTGGSVYNVVPLPYSIHKIAPISVRKQSFSRASYDLLSSMRFAISLLTILAIASIIGTVLKQNEPYPNYVVEFGQYWFALFEVLGLYDVYHSGWFLAILAFLVLSTGLCIYRNGPSMLKEIRSYRETAQENSLRHFSHQAEFEASSVNASTIERLQAYLSQKGFRSRLKPTGADESDTLVAAKAGSYHRLGYFLTHSAIVIICIGGLLDGNIPLKLQTLLGDKKIETRDIPQSQVPPVSRLSPANLSYRGSVTIPEGSAADVVFLNVGEGYLVQDLPFIIGLKRFHIDHYSTGQPKSFASDLVVTDKETNETFEHTITVNHPLIYKGVAIYQASFGDGGTKMDLQAWNLFSREAQPLPVRGEIHGTTKIAAGADAYTLEFTDFRPFNIENFGAPPSAANQNGAMKDVMSVFGTGAGKKDHDLRNVGPSFQYKVRDAQGQAREYQNYMLPILIENRWYLVSGMRSSPSEGFRYIRFPMDAEGRLAGFMGLRAVLLDPVAHEEIVKRFAESAFSGEAIGDTLREKVLDSTRRVLDMFASGGYDALANFIERAIPENEQQQAIETYLKILESVAFHAYQLARERAGLEPAAVNEQSILFIRDSLNAFSDLYFYGAPIYLQLEKFDEVKSSGLQLTRSPGKNIVYAGSVLLILGVFVMFYIRERRIWLLVKPKQGSVLFAMSGNRKTLDFEKEFDDHKKAIADLLKGS